MPQLLISAICYVESTDGRTLIREKLSFKNVEFLRLSPIFYANLEILYANYTINIEIDQNTPPYRQKYSDYYLLVVEMAAAQSPIVRLVHFNICILQIFQSNSIKF